MRTYSISLHADCHTKIHLPPSAQAVHPQISDITHLSRLRRSVGFPRRAAQAIVQLVAMAVALWLIMVVVARLYEALLGRPWYDGPPTTVGTEMWFTLGAATFFGLIYVGLCYGAAQGRRWAIVALVASAVCLLLLIVVSFGLDASAGFKHHDIPPNIESGVDRASLDLGDDIRLVPRHLYGLVVILVYIALWWRMTRAWFPRRQAIAPAERTLVFSSPPRFSLIARHIRDWARHPIHLGAVVQALIASALYLAYMILNAVAIMCPFLPITGLDSDYRALNFVVNTLGLENLTLIYIVEGLRFAEALLEARVLFWIARFFLMLSNRSVVLSADRARAVDMRPPVLYLRSFRNDRLAAIDPSEKGVLAMFDPYKETATFEELIVRRCDSLGPVVAIADPKVRLPPFGAARKRAGDADWHELVKGYMAEAACTVVLMDFTENLKWEIERLVEGGHVANTWFLFPPVADRVHYLEMLAIAAEAVFPDQPNPFTSVAPSLQVCALARRGDDALIVASRTTTFADYDIALQYLIRERSAVAHA